MIPVDGDGIRKIDNPVVIHGAELVENFSSAEYIASKRHDNQLCHC